MVLKLDAVEENGVWIVYNIIDKDIDGGVIYVKFLKDGKVLKIGIDMYNKDNGIK